MNRSSITRPGAVLVISVLLIASGAGLVQAAVSGSFDATYDRTGDSSAAGKEIHVSGSIQVSGESAVQPRVIIRSADGTVLATDSVRVFVEQGDAQLNTRYRKGQVVARTEEIPSGTAVRVEFNVYPTTIPSEGSLKVAEVVVRWETPGGTNQRKVFEPTADVNSTAYETIDQQEKEINSLEAEVQRLKTYRTVGFAGIGLGVIGILAAVGIWYINREPDKPPV